MKIDSIADTSIHPSIQESFAGSADADADAVPSLPWCLIIVQWMEREIKRVSERGREGGRNCKLVIVELMLTLLLLVEGGREEGG